MKAFFIPSRTLEQNHVTSIRSKSPFAVRRDELTLLLWKSSLLFYFTAHLSQYLSVLLTRESADVFALKVRPNLLNISAVRSKESIWLPQVSSVESGVVCTTESLRKINFLFSVRRTGEFFTVVERTSCWMKLLKFMFWTSKAADLDQEV